VALTVDALLAGWPWPWAGPAAGAVAMLAAAVLGVAFWAWRRRRGQTGGAAAEALDTVLGWSPRATRVLSSDELRAHALLVQALPQHLVLAQVPLSRFIRVPTRNSYAEWLRRVGHLNADFIVCDAQAQVLAVVELRSTRPRGGERIERRHQRFARVLKQAGIPLQVWTDGALPSVADVRATLPPLPAAAPPPRLASAASLAAAAAAATPATRSVPPGFESTQFPVDEVIEMREPPSSTWFDDFDSGAAPLEPPKRRP